MKTHPIIDYPYRWVPVLVVALVLVLAQVMIMSGNNWLAGSHSLFGLVCGRSCFVVPDGYNHDNRWKPVMAGG